MRTRKECVLRRLAALNEYYNEVTAGNKVSVSVLCKKHSIGNEFFTTAKRAGIVSYQTGEGNYSWAAQIRPNIHMVKRILSDETKQRRGYPSNHPTTKKANIQKTECQRKEKGHKAQAAANQKTNRTHRGRSATRRNH